MKNQGENKNRNNINTYASWEESRILCYFPFHLELGMFWEILSTICYFDELWTSLSCVQYPIWFRLRNYRNQRINKNNMWQGKNTNACRAILRAFWRSIYLFGLRVYVGIFLLLLLFKKIISMLLYSKYIYVYLGHFNRQNSFHRSKIT